MLHDIYWVRILDFEKAIIPQKGFQVKDLFGGSCLALLKWQSCNDCAISVEIYEHFQSW